MSKQRQEEPEEITISEPDLKKRRGPASVWAARIYESVITLEAKLDKARQVVTTLQIELEMKEKAVAQETPEVQAAYHALREASRGVQGSARGAIK